MPASNLSRWWDVKQIGDVTVVTFLQPETFHEETIDLLGKELLHLFGQLTIPHLLLNFRPVDRMSSHLLGELLVLHKKVLNAGGRLALCEFNPLLRDTFRVLGLEQVFRIYDREAEAVASFAK
jgi:anti-anti-sigma factor